MKDKLSIEISKKTSADDDIKESHFGGRNYERSLLQNRSLADVSGYFMLWNNIDVLFAYILVRCVRRRFHRKAGRYLLV